MTDYDFGGPSPRPSFGGSNEESFERQMLSARVRELENYLARCALVIKTLKRICVDKGVFDEAEFNAKFDVVDLEDGRRDGQLKPTKEPRTCNNCGKPNNYAATSCMYCGGVLKPNSPL